MKISNKTDYALRTLLDIALHNDNGAVSIGVLARRQAIPQKFLEQIMLSLKSAGIVNSTRGSKGGYVLAKSLSEISLSTIVGVTDSRLTESVLQGNGSNGEFSSETEKLLGEVWGEVGETIQEKLESISIDDLCVRVKTARANSIPDYVI